MCCWPSRLTANNSVSSIILHQFDISPFAEKVRLALGIKGLSWHAVDIPAVMPKPDLTALTGGYRKTPVMQIGADVYCDTQRIARELERRWPEPSLFPSGSEGLCMALAQWSDVAFFRPGAALSMGTNPDLPEAILRDRRQFFSFLDFERLEEDLPHFYAQFEVQLQLLQDMLGETRAFLLGDVPSWADILAWFPVWMCRANIAGAESLLKPWSRVLQWEARIRKIGYGQRSSLDAEEALKIARESRTVTEASVQAGNGLGLESGDAVVVTPEDYGAVPVSGALKVLTHRDIAILREDPRAGQVTVHFPRAGYRVDREY